MNLESVDYIPESTFEVNHTPEALPHTLITNLEDKNTKHSTMRPSSFKRKKAIVDSARELYETQGMAHTNIQDITSHIDLTRSLFYHYFPDKIAVTQAVIDSYVDEYIERLTQATAESQFVRIEDILTDATNAAFRPELKSNPFIQELHERKNASFYSDLINRAARRSADFILEKLRDDASPQTDFNVHTFERYYLFFLGLFTYFRHYPELDKESVRTLISRSIPVPHDKK